MKLTHTNFQLILSWLSVLWEGFWLALWPSLGVLGFAVSIALFDLPSWIPAWIHAALLVVGVVALATTLWYAISNFHIPTRQIAIRRLQNINDLTHRPLESLSDKLAEELGNSESWALWRLHRARMKAQTSSLRVGMPHPHLIRNDRFGLRIGLGVLLIAGLTAAGNKAPERLQQALVPQLAVFTPPKQPIIDAWLTPPNYTGTPPVFLAGPNTESRNFAAVPVGTIFSIRVSGAEGTPKILRIRSQTDTKLLDGETYGADLKLNKSETITIVIEDDVIAEWILHTTPDSLPVTSFLSTPNEGIGNILQINFRASNDYGLTGARAVITRDHKNKPAKADAKQKILNLPLPRLGAIKAASSSYHDMTSHPWAGLQVRIHLEATDAAGQVGRSGAVRIILPEREFTQPVARKIVFERRKLIAEPDEAELVANTLRDIAQEPERYQDDVTVFLALDTVVRRLTDDHGEVDLDLLQHLLWDTAIRIEDGKLSIIRRNLQEAEEELEATLGNYLNEFSKMMKPTDQKVTQERQKKDRAKALTRQDLKKLMDVIRKLTKSGAHADAKQLLAQLNNMLTNMRAGQIGRISTHGQESMKLLNQLQNIIKKQEKLLNQTFRNTQRRGQIPLQTRRRERGQNMSRRGPPQRKMQPGEMSHGAQTQEKLRRQLGEIMRQLGEMTVSIPRPMGRAERAMQQSSKFLSLDRQGEAIKPQTRALDQLQESAKTVTRRLMHRMKQKLSQRPGEIRHQQDPFGRTPDGFGDLSNKDVDIYGADAPQRARQIRNELRNRAGQRHRPEPERDYIDRLLKRF
jgi:uncharacterized protein (TIGR02302 family)